MLLLKRHLITFYIFQHLADNYLLDVEMLEGIDWREGKVVISGQYLDGKEYPNFEIYVNDNDLIIRSKRRSTYTCCDSEETHVGYKSVRKIDDVINDIIGHINYEASTVSPNQAYDNDLMKEINAYLTERFGQDMHFTSELKLYKQNGSVKIDIGDTCEIFQTNSGIHILMPEISDEEYRPDSKTYNSDSMSKHTIIKAIGSDVNEYLIRTWLRELQEQKPVTKYIGKISYEMCQTLIMRCNEERMFEEQLIVMKILQTFPENKKRFDL